MNKTPRWPSGTLQTSTTVSSDLKWMLSSGAGRLGEEVEADSVPMQEREVKKHGDGFTDPL